MAVVHKYWNEMALVLLFPTSCGILYFSCMYEEKCAKHSNLYLPHGIL